MKLRSIRLNNVRRFTEPVEITGIGPGLNVLSAPNENGKSTLFDALHALFFFDAKSWKQKEAATLAPHAGGNPEVSAQIEVDGEVFKISKTFTKTASKGEVTVHRDGHLFKQADAAEVWIRDLIKSPKDGGPAGLLWVRQGLTTLHAHKDDDTLTARRGLLSSVAGEIEDVTGGRKMEAIRAALKVDLERYVTKTGKVSSNGLLGQARNAVEALSTVRTQLETQVNGLRTKLSDRRNLVAEQTVLKDPETVKQQETKLHAANADLEAAEAHAAKHSAALSHVASIELALEGNRVRLTSLRERLRECDNASEEMRKTSDALKEHSKGLNAVAQELERAQTQETDTRAVSTKARAALDAVLATEADRQDVARRKELSVRLKDAQALTVQAANARKSVAAAPSRADMAVLEDAWRDYDLLDRANNASAAAITLDCALGQTDRITLNDMALPQGVRTPLPQGGTIKISGIGSIQIHPAELGEAKALGKARAHFDQALLALAFDTLEHARKAARTRDEAQENLDRYEAQLKIAAPEGIDTLLTKIASLPEHVAADDVDLPSRTDAETAVGQAQEAHQSALVKLESAQARHRTVQDSVLRAQVTRDHAQTRSERAYAAIEDVDAARTQITTLQATGDDLQNDFNQAAAAVEELSKDAPDLEFAKASATRARGVAEQTRARLHEIDKGLARLEALIDHEAGLAVEEQLAETEGRLSTAKSHEADVLRELKVLQRLDAALAAAQADAHEAYIGPIIQELRPLLRMVLPGAELKLDADTVLPTGLVRPEGEDSYDQLSGGTQEQIALLVRLAFARLLANAGTPAPIILDDAIVYTDDDRIERMFDALTKQASDQQIIVLSCRQKVFRGLGGQTLTIQKAGPDLAS